MDIIQKAAKKISGAKPSQKPLVSRVQADRLGEVDNIKKHSVPRHTESIVSKK